MASWPEQVPLGNQNDLRQVQNPNHNLLLVVYDEEQNREDKMDDFEEFHDPNLTYSTKHICILWTMLGHSKFQTKQSFFSTTSLTGLGIQTREQGYLKGEG